MSFIPRNNNSYYGGDDEDDDDDNSKLAVNTMTARCRSLMDTVLYRLNARIAGSNPAHGLDVCRYFPVLCRQRPFD
jgi:hypothetical protein